METQLQDLLSTPPSGDHDRIVQMHAVVTFIARDLYGNGRKGLMEQVQSLSRFKWMMVGVGMAIGSGATVLATVAAWTK